MYPTLEIVGSTNAVPKSALTSSTSVPPFSTYSTVYCNTFHLAYNVTSSPGIVAGTCAATVNPASLYQPANS